MGLENLLRKPVIAITICLFIILVGLAAYFKLPVRQFPLLPSSEVTITTQYPGASPSVMEGYVTMPLETALSGLDNMDYMSSENTDGQSVITLKFFMGTNIDALLPQIANRVESSRWELPKDILDPVIEKVDPNAAATGAILYMSATSPVLSPAQMTAYMSNVYTPAIDGIPGVKEVQLFGGQTYAMRIWLNPAKMANYHITALDVQRVLESQNVQSTSGVLNGKYMKFDVATSSNLSTEKQFNNILIRQEKGNYVRIKDIGHAQLSATDVHSNAYANGLRAVVSGIIVTDSANAIDVANKIMALMPELQKAAPPGLKLETIWDVTQFSRASIHEVYVTIAIAVAFVFLVIFIFLGSFRSISIPFMTIPLSLLGATALMWLLGYSSNTLTLLAWVLAIGLVVDDAIVVIENVDRHMQLGEPRFLATLKGVKEIRGPIITMTLVVAIVFIPIGFVPGISGALFKEFAFTLSLIVLVSGFLALFVSPVMCAHMLNEDLSSNKIAMFIDKVFDKIRGAYKHLLTHVLNIRWFVVLVYIFLICAGLFIVKSIPSDLIPTENENVLIGLGLGPSSANDAYLSKYSKAMSQVYGSMPETQSSGLYNGFALMGATNVTSWVVLKPHTKGQRTEDQVQSYMSKQFARIPGLMSMVFKQPTIPGALPGQDIKFVLKTNRPYDELEQQMKRLIAAANKFPGISDANTTFQVDKPEVKVVIDRRKADALNVPIGEINATLNVALGMPIINHFVLQGYSYEVIPQTYRRFRMEPNQIKNMYVRSNNGNMVSLNSLVKIEESVAPQSLDQFQQQNSAILQANIEPGFTMGQDLGYLENYVKNNMPSTFDYDFVGQSRQFIHSQGVLLVAFMFAIILIYLLLSAHFNSLRDPFIVLLSVPLALVGALFVMFMFGSTLNIYTKIGLVMLLGLISKHGILIIDFANYLQEQGKPVREAIIEAAAIRLRPILMTTFAMVFGALPLVLAHGAGSIARNQIGWVVIGGMSLGTCLTLFVVPTAYTLLAKRHKSANKASV
tara:strand:+ start:147521 stop:150580 length:3060 start_codon:yes stop_codon:yes gene_type:complete